MSRLTEPDTSSLFRKLRGLISLPKRKHTLHQQRRRQVGVARGALVTGCMGAQRVRMHFFGPAVVAATQLAGECAFGETRVHRSLARAEGCAAFDFGRARCGAGLLLFERRRLRDGAF